MAMIADYVTGYLKDFKKCIPVPSLTVQTKHGEQHLLRQVIRDPGNWRAGITVSFVSVPLSIALGIASGTSPQRGVTTAIWGGLSAGLLGSSDYNIVGPAGALSGMFNSYAYSWTDEVLPWISCVSCILCGLCALARLHTYMLFMPTSVFEGFTVGVALIIGLNQINFACGLSPEKKHKHFFMNVYESVATLDEIKWPSFIVFAIQMPLLYILMRKIPKIPWTVIMPVISIPLGAVATSYDLGFELLTLKSKYGMLKPTVVMPLEPLSDLVPSSEMFQFVIAAISTAVVAVLETLISAKIAGTRVDRTFDELLEMRGLTVAHALCGVFGAMPPTGVFVRTSLNTNLGATHRFSQFLNACAVLIIFVAAMPAFSYVPQATIAALLVVSSIRMTPVTYLKKLWRENKGALALCMVTALICVFEDPVIGLAVGMIIALLRGAKKMLTAEQLRICHEVSESGGRIYNVQLLGALTYLNSDGFTSQARSLEEAAEIHFDLDSLCVLDHDGATAVNKVVSCWLEKLKEENLYLTGVATEVAAALKFYNWFENGQAAGRIIVVEKERDASRMPSSHIRISTVSAEINASDSAKLAVAAAEMEKSAIKTPAQAGAPAGVLAVRELQEDEAPVVQNTAVEVVDHKMEQFEHAL